ncbi:MAG TPA: PP2C family serine/threonine-protein phosphatase [Gemmatimonadaceae bacterium]|nr:PP2C family serine/threonine-protein phosphatase [Gemmatimonadaceae bacterium]
MPVREIPDPPAAPRGLVVVAGGRTDVGRVRNLNEDSYLVAALGRDAVVMKGATTTLTVPHTPALLVVADGVGGAASGEIASLMATDTMFIELRRRYESEWPRTPAGVEAALRSAMSSANHVIFTYASGNPQHRGMATTATLALVHHSVITIAQVGDSRAYLVRGGEARQITKDQSLIQRLIDAGEMTEGEAAHSDRRNIILQALGSEATVIPDMYRELAEVGDVLVLCSDGLSNLVGANDIARIALADDNMETVCERLVSCANSRGGHDNITVVAARFEPADPNEPPPPPAPTTRESTSPGLSDRVRRWLR